MKKLLLILLLLISFLYSKDRQVYTKAKVERNKVIVHLYNYSHHHVTIKYNPTYRNLIPLGPLPFIRSYSPMTKTKIFEFRISSKNFKYSGKYNWVLGTQKAVHNDNTLYRLPYKKGTSQVVTQGFNGLFSHKGSSQYAVDFGMKEGTAIYAMRAGIVAKTKKNSKIGGPSRKFIAYANSITLRHADNTYAMYSHLKYKGVRVKEGDFIKRGQLIGYSGNTGFSRGPHLHLVVYKIDNLKQKSLPIKFISKRGVIKKPIRGMRYTAVK